MKKRLFIALFICASMLAHAQIYTPNGAIQGSSGNNNVGIGTNNPQANLEINNPSAASMRLFVNQAVGYGWDILNNGGNLEFNYSTSTGGFTTYFIIDTVQIGLNGYTRIFNNARIDGGLEVDGKIDCEDLEVKVVVSNSLKTKEINTDKLNLKVDNVADYVFEPDYKLRPLSEVEEFVNQNKHLPDIPSGKTLEENGMDVAEMNNLLLQKIEELTLYMIEIKKENEELKSEVQKLKQK